MVEERIFTRPVPALVPPRQPMVARFLHGGSAVAEGRMVLQGTGTLQSTSIDGVHIVPNIRTQPQAPCCALSETVMAMCKSSCLFGPDLCNAVRPRLPSQHRFPTVRGCRLR